METFEDNSKLSDVQKTKFVTKTILKDFTHQHISLLILTNRK